MLRPYATWRASEGHFFRALRACVHYFSAYPRIFFAKNKSHKIKERETEETSSIIKLLRFSGR
jgi:hypothetical protein